MINCGLCQISNFLHLGTFSKHDLLLFSFYFETQTLKGLSILVETEFAHIHSQHLIKWHASDLFTKHSMCRIWWPAVLLNL